MPYGHLFRKDLLLPIAVALLIFFFQLGAAPLWDRDEPRNAGCAAEMLAANDWVVPVFNGELRTHKPVLLYWLMMASYSLGGISEFTARFASACLGVGTVALTHQIARILFDRKVAMWAGIILPTTLMFSVAARAATPDSLLVFCSTLAIYIFVRFAFQDREQPTTRFSFGMPSRRSVAAMIYAAMGLGVLAKGPVGLVLPTAVIGMYLLIRTLPDSPRENGFGSRLLAFARPFAPAHFLRTCWSMRPITALATAGMVAIPWYAWVAYRTGGVWTNDFFLIHNVSRATHTMEGHSGPPILFYVVAVLAGFFPWSIVTIPTAMRMHTIAKSGNTRTRSAISLLLCWIGVYIGLFSLASTKLPSYVTPCYPAIAILVAVFVQDWRDSANISRLWVKVGLVHLIAIGAGLTVGLPLAAQRFLPGSEWVGVVGLIPILGGFICWQFIGHQRDAPATSILGYTAVALVLFLTAILPNEISQHRKYDELFATLRRHDGPIAAYGHLEPSWIFYSGRSIREFSVGEAAELSDFLDQNPATYVITTPERLTEKAIVESHFPSEQSVVHETEYFIRDRPLLLLQQQQPNLQFADRPQRRK